MDSIPTPRQYLPSLKSGIALAIAVPVCAFVHGLFSAWFDVTVNVFELGPGGMGLTFPYNTKFIVNFLAMCIGLGLVFWLSLKAALRNIEGRERVKSIIEALAVVGIIVNAMGVVFHWGFDRANSFYTHEYGYDATDVYLYLYFGDEWLGHGLQQTSMLAFFALLVVSEQLAPRSRRIHWVEWLWLAGIIGVVAVTNGYAALRSESAILMLVASVVMLCGEAGYCLGKRPRLLESPLLLGTIVANAIVVVENVVFIAMYGLSPWYPWLRP
ncbi:MAG: hypothetical protein JW839_08740 [Candidatus Lokiarchaeota archaeon]|nr:hypothetical protein [Candidatus Lokiarchaeota archaeon]